MKRWKVAPLYLSLGIVTGGVVLGPLALPVSAQAQSPEELLAAASALFDAKKYAEAALRLEQFLQANPKHAKAGPAALALGRCYTQTKQYPKAILAYDKAIASKDGTVLAQAQLGLGEAAIFSSDWEKATTALDAAVKNALKAEQASLAYLWLGQANYQLERFPASEAAYLKVTQLYATSDFVDNAWFGAGLAAQRQGKADAARQRLKTVVDRFPKSLDRPQAHLALAQLEFDAKRFREARVAYEALLNDPAAKAAGAEVTGPAEEGLIGVLLELQDFAAASARLDAVLARLPANDPQRWRAQLTLGHARYRQKQYEPALAAYIEAAKSTDGTVAGEGHYWAANASIALKRPAEAATQFGQVATRFPKHPLAARALLKQGDALLEAKQPDAAAAAYRKVSAAYPQAPEAAEAQKALGDAVNSLSDPVKLALALKSMAPAERVPGTLRLARLYLDGKKYAEAVAPLTDLLKANPPAEAVAEANYLLGLSYEAQEKPAPALQAFAEAVKRGGTATWVADAHTRAAWLALDQKQAPQAEVSANAALALKPAVELERQARLALLQAQLDQEKWDAALEASRQLQATNPPADTLAMARFTEAWATEKKGKVEEALPLWSRLLADHPKSDYAADALLHLGDAELRGEKWDAARQRYSALLTGFPKSPLVPEARYKLGTTHFNQEKWAEAVVELDRVGVDKAAGDLQPLGLYWAGMAYDRAGKKLEAIDRLTKFTVQFPKHELVMKAKIKLAGLKAVASGE